MCYIVFLMSALSAQKHKLWVLIRIPMVTSTHNKFLSRNLKHILFSKFSASGGVIFNKYE